MHFNTLGKWSHKWLEEKGISENDITPAHDHDCTVLALTRIIPSTSFTIRMFWVGNSFATTTMDFKSLKQININDQNHDNSIDTRSLSRKISERINKTLQYDKACSMNIVGELLRMRGTGI